MYYLLTTNSKLEKSVLNHNEIRIMGLSLAPHRIDGFEVCFDSTIACRSACNLWFSGRTVTDIVRSAAIRRKRMLRDNPKQFERLLRLDLDRLQSLSIERKYTALVRLNTASDLDWFDIIADYPRLRFYDYSPNVERVRANRLANYAITYSRKENSDNRTIASLLKRGLNVAIVYDVAYRPNGRHPVIGSLPETHTIGSREYPVVDGDRHDARIPEIDGAGVVVGLRLKGTNRAKHNARRSGFAIPYSDSFVIPLSDWKDAA